MDYAPFEKIFPPLKSVKLPLGCAPLETAQTLPGYEPLEVGQEGKFLVVTLEFGNNVAILQASLCNCEFSGRWIAAEQDLLMQGRPNTGISHRAL